MTNASDIQTTSGGERVRVLRRTSTGHIGTVALVGMSRPIPVRSQHLLRHCGFIVAQIERDPVDLRALLGRIRLDAIVVDARPLSGSKDPDPSFLAVLSCATAVAPDETPKSLIVLGNGRTPWVRQAAHDHGAVFLWTGAQGPNYLELARLLRDLRGLSSECCLPPAAR